MEVDQIELAQQKLANILKHPDDLSTKLLTLKTRLLQEKTTNDALMKGAVSGRLDDVADAVTLLGTANRNLQEIGNRFEVMQKVPKIPKEIQEVSAFHRKFQSTRDIMNKFQALSEDIQKTSALIKSESADVTGGQHDKLYEIHYKLFKLEEFRDETVAAAKLQGPSVMNIVNTYFKRLDALTDQFKQYVWQLSKNLIFLVQDQKYAVIVRLCKIIEAEEYADEQQLQSNGAYPRTIKNYRSFMFNAIHESIGQHFQRMIPNEQNVVDALENSHFIFDDLALVFDELTPRFPPKYKVFPFYVLQYHKLTYDLLNRLTQRVLETRDILVVLGWVRDYYKVMNERLGVTEELLEPKLLDDNETRLTTEYVKLIREKLLEWVDRLLDNEVKEFITRENPPETDNDGMYGTSSAVILFQIINQQLDIVIEAAKGGRLLLDVTQECCRTLTHFQEKQIQMLELEEQKFQKKEEMPGGLSEYVMAFCNNHLKCSEFMEQIQKRLEETMDSSLRPEAVASITITLEGFMKVARRGAQTLQQLMFGDLQSSMSLLFTPLWYENSPMPAVIATMSDYLQDYKSHLQDYLFNKVATDCMDKFVQLYLQAMRGKSVKFKMPQALQLIKPELDSITQFWQDYRTAKRVKAAFDVVEKVVAILDSSSTIVYVSWYALWKTYNDVPQVFIEDLLNKRDDLERSALKEVLQSIRAKYKEGGNTDAVASNKFI